ncbi:MAG: hypothetical protein KatS3mg074_343 [Meiothermus sp.]|uniref:Outer membrane protein beta-barrel domain-containing protein n=2 Tax=Meiothermus hypogaeus TaxID=884155 RepID=A0A511R2U1_9DEIN|nr:hypothetical protein [Meiothermus hypogaeus]RIH81060.1 hypothetical protein Mhypo_00101 [Meiothermus hypogaeus]GEM83316.1 hypothetical protein MHY01S_14820 [Meiothermus hypogaeus NBRC 106114]GIW37945.1 MAG: hypothetical protein KatS3mg074_343 [Meiothermus sp.]
MKRLPVLIVLLLLVFASSGFAQRAFQLRISVPAPSLGFGLEANLQRDLVALIYGDVLFTGPRFLIGGEVLFKPDLGQFDRDLRGIKPYFGGGLGLGLPNANFALTLDAGIEFALDRDTGLFIGGQSIFPFNSSPSARLLFGATFR